MPIDFNFPATTAALNADVFTDLANTKKALGSMLDTRVVGSYTNPFQYAHRYNYIAGQGGAIEEYNGSSWVVADLARQGLQPSLGYTPVNKAGDSGLGNMSAASWQASSFILSPSFLGRTSGAESTQRLHFNGQDVAGTTRYLWGLDTDNQPTLWTYALGGTFQSQFKFKNTGEIYSQAGSGVTGLNLGDGAGTVLARQFKSGAGNHVFIDAASSQAIFLNYYTGSAVYLGNGASGIVGSIDSAGAASFAGSISNGYGGVNGYVTLSKGNSTITGHIDFFTGAGVRNGYIGFNNAGAGILYDTDSVGIHLFQQDIQFNSGVGAQKVGYRGMPVRTAAASAALLATDAGRLILSGAASVAHTIPASTYTIGDVLVVNANSFTGSTIVPASGVTLNWPNAAGSSISAGTRTLAAYGQASLIMTAANVWEISGRGIS